MGIQTDILRTIVECRGAENMARKFGLIGAAAGAAEKKLQAVADRAGQISLVAGGLGTGMLAAAGGLLKVAGAAEQAQIAFTTLLKSPQEAKKHLAELAQFAAKTPFEFTGLRTLSTQLLAFGFNAKSVIPMLETLGDAGSALGQGPEGLSRMIRAIGQIQAKGRVQMQELLQLAEAGLPVFQILQDELGLTAAQVGEIGREGVSAKDGIAALLRGMDKLYGGGMAAQAQTFSGVTSNLKDQLGLLGMEIGSTLIPYMTRATKAAVELLERLRDTSPSVKAAIGAFLLFGGAGLILVSVAARIKQLQVLWALSALQKKRAAEEAVVAEKAEQSAVMQTAAAYRAKAVALAASGDIRGANAAFGAMVGNAGSWANAPLVASTGILRRTSEALSGAFSSLKASVLGLLTPMNVLAAGLFGIGYMYKRMVSDEWAKTREGWKAYEDMGQNAPHQQLQWFGSNPRGGEPLAFGANKPDFDTWAKARGVDTSKMRADIAWVYRKFMMTEYEGDLWQRPIGLKAGHEDETASAKAQAQRVAEWLDKFRSGAEGAGMSVQRAQALQGAGLGNDYAATLVNEAAAQLKLMQALQQAATVETDAEAKKKLLSEAERARTDGITSATNAINENRRAEEAAARQADEQAKNAIESKRKAVEEYTKAIDEQTKALNNTLSVGNAYAQYLETIGMKAEADRYRRSEGVMAAVQSAHWAFSIGDKLGGWQAATEAERLARAGMDDKGSLGFGGGGRRGALTGAVPSAYVSEAVMRQTPPVVVRIDNTVRDEAGTVRARTRREDRNRYYAAGVN